jgi:hypothetical protein
MVMEQIQCVHCGDFFDRSPRHKNQTACKKPECQKAKKAAWQRFKMKTDPDYRAGQRHSWKQWARENPDYWRRYRKKNPEKAERNRTLQAIRNRKARGSKDLGKMDASKSYCFETLGQFWLIPLIAKMDTSKVNIVKIPIYYS